MVEFGSVRRSQLISTYGVGAIVAIDNKSGMIAGLHRWRIENEPDLHEPRLQHVLGVRRFIAPPARNPNKKPWGIDQNVPVVRFPTIYWCPECKRLDRFGALASELDARCNQCRKSLVPSRFIICCENGHIDDFPYMEWVHGGRKPTGVHVLRVETAGVSASLADFEIVCSCGERKSMENAFAPDVFQGWFRCTGRRPWIGDHETGCNKVPRTLQRGASNVYFPITTSAISIPPWSEPVQKFIERHWHTLQFVPPAALVPTLEGMQAEKFTGYTVHQVAEMIMERREGQVQLARSEEELRRQEYAALVRGRPETSRDQDFVCLPADGAAEVADLFQQVMVVTRLREVRALRGFVRLRPVESGESDRIASMSPEPLDWLPAIEVVGEGVFLRLKEDQLKRWESQNEILYERIDVLDRNYRRRCQMMHVSPGRRITPRFVLLHTMAHVLIDQWALDCGYPAGSLRERLYYSEDDVHPMAGILIYTAASDSAGSLGGVVSRASRGKLRESVLEAYRRAQWCSSDPLCLESEGRGVDALNLAACHCCCLLPETSCEHQNVFLDRALLVGTPEHPELGFLRTVLGGM